MKTLSMLVLFLSSFSGIGQSIFEIQGQTSSSPYDGMIVTTSGIVTAVGDESYFIQDGEGPWSGLYVYDQSLLPEVGDEIDITGTIDEFYGMTEMVSVSEIIVLSVGNPLPLPSMLSTGEVNLEDYESVLVQVNAECTNPDIGFGEFELNDGSGPCSVDDLMYLYGAELGIEYSVSGPVLYSFGASKIIPSNEDDILIANPLYFTVNPEEFNISQFGLSIHWETNAPSNSIVERGFTPALELPTITIDELVTEHSVNILEVDPSTVMYLRIHSEDGVNSTTLQDRVVITSSESDGNIEVYFNHITDPTVATNEEAVWTLSIADTIISYINLAEETLDIAIYDLLGADPAIFEAINAQHENGVQVRYISDDGTENLELDLLNSEIPVLLGNGDNLMHDKFIIIDKDNHENSWVMTGSTNHTNANLGWDYNNVICVRDQSLAIAYTLEFEEMWGSSSDMPDPDNSKFGSEKSDNTPHKFIFNDVEAELYFSPSDGTAGKIKEAIEDAENELAFAVLVFTENSLGDAVLGAHQEGLEVRGIIDYVEFNGSEYDYLLDNGVNVMDYQNEDGTQWPDGPTLHHKYAILDYSVGSENPLLITGSHNWSASANSVHDENALFIYDHTIANIYLQEFEARWNNTPDVSVEEMNMEFLSIYPNPAADQIRIESKTGSFVQIFDELGRKVIEEILDGNQTVDISFLTDGNYIIRILDDDLRTGKFVKR